jgi:DNA-binding LacI/PurR family transcriptional regulator
MAVGALRAIAEAGLSVPDDIAVMGFDGLPVHARTYPHLSTIAQSIPNLGRFAVNLLLKRVSEPDGAAEHLYLDARLELRGSCGCGAPAGQFGDEVHNTVQHASKLISPNSHWQAPASPACT